MHESALNAQPRGTLGWRTADELWRARPSIDVDLQALAEDVNDRAEKVRRSLNVAPAHQDLAWRLAVKQTSSNDALKTRKGAGARWFFGPTSSINAGSAPSTKRPR